MQADYIGSTSGLLGYVQESPAQAFIVATEFGIMHEMQKRAPGKNLIPAPPNNECACNQCDYMKLNTTEKLYRCMTDRQPEITLDESLRKRALRPIERMLQLGAETVDPEAVFSDLVMPFPG